MCGFIAHSVEHRTGIRDGHGFLSRWSNDFLLLKLENLLRWSFFTLEEIFHTYARPCIILYLLYDWRFSRYSVPIHWLVHGHMTSNSETVSRQKSWEGKIGKTMTSKGKQFTVTSEVLTAVAHDKSWPDVVAGISARYSKFAFVFLCYITNHLMAGPLAGPLIPSNLNVSLDFVSGIAWVSGFSFPRGRRRKQPAK